MLEGEGPVRRWLKDRKPLLRQGLIVPASGEVVDESIESLKRNKIEDWVAMGVPRKMSEYAIKLAEEYAQGMAGFIYPNDPAAQKSMLPALFKAAINKVSEPWIKGILKALGK